VAARSRRGIAAPIRLPADRLVPYRASGPGFSLAGPSERQGYFVRKFIGVIAVVVIAITGVALAHQPGAVASGTPPTQPGTTRSQG
jgi:hypothetical protein